MLEVGCGEGSILSWLDQWNYCPEIHAVDISDSGIRETSGKKLTHLVSAQVFDGYTLPFPDDYFDVACCAHVIEHVEFPRILDRKSVVSGKSVSVRVDLGGGGIIKK